MSSKPWVPSPGSICRVNGHVGRYIGDGAGAYLADPGSDVLPENRAVRYYRATKPEAGDRHTHASLLPTIDQLEAVAQELGIRKPLVTP